MAKTPKEINIMKTAIKKTLLIASLAGLTAISTVQAYDGRGSEDCEDLKEQIIFAKEQLVDWQRFSNRMSAQQDRWGMVTENWQTDRSRSISEIGTSFSREHDDDVKMQRQSEYDNAMHTYNMNGCTSGGRTVYNHSYNY
jgi:hypothetical protein